MKNAKKDFTTSFEDFLDSNDVESQEEKEDLENAVLKRTESGNFKCWEQNGQIFVEGWSDVIMRIASEEAKNRLVRRLARLHQLGGLGEANAVEILGGEFKGRHYRG